MSNINFTSRTFPRIQWCVVWYWVSKKLKLVFLIKISNIPVVAFITLVLLQIIQIQILLELRIKICCCLKCVWNNLLRVFHRIIFLKKSNKFGAETKFRKGLKSICMCFALNPCNQTIQGKRKLKGQILWSNNHQMCPTNSMQMTHQWIQVSFRRWHLLNLSITHFFKNQVNHHFSNQLTNWVHYVNASAVHTIHQLLM